MTFWSDMRDTGKELTNFKTKYFYKYFELIEYFKAKYFYDILE